MNPGVKGLDTASYSPAMHSFVSESTTCNFYACWALWVLANRMSRVKYGEGALRSQQAFMQIMRSSSLMILLPENKDFSERQLGSAG